MNIRTNVMQTVILFCIVLLAGFFSGWAWGTYFSKKRIHSFIVRTPEERKHFLIQRLKKDLNLDHDQETAIENILKESFSKIHNLREKYAPKERAIIGESLDKIEKVLREDQQKEWKKVKDILLRAKSHPPPDFHSPPPPPPPPPRED